MRMKRYGSMLWVLGLVCVLTGGCSVRGEISRLSENGERETLGTEEMDLQQENDPDAYSARTAHPFQRNGAPFRFRLSKAQQVY